LTVLGFEKQFPRFYEKLCSNAHPIFTSRSRLVLYKGDLELIEIKMLGFMWQAQQLPPQNFFIKNDENSEETINVFEMYKIKE
jgi:hypothetical protein